MLLWGLFKSLGYYSTVDRDNFEDGDGNEVLGTAADQDLMFLKASGYIADNQYLSISAEQRDEDWRPTTSSTAKQNKYNDHV